MRIGIAAVAVAALMMVLWTPGGSAATQELYFHGELPLGNLEEAGGTMDGTAPDGDVPKLYLASNAGDPVTKATFVGPEVDVSGAEIIVDFFVVLGPYQTAAWACCWDPSFTVAAEIAGQVVASKTFTQFNTDPPLGIIPYSVMLEGVTGTGTLTITIIESVVDEVDVFVAYDSVDAPSQITIQGGGPGASANQPPVAMLDADTTTGPKPLKVTFTLSATDLEGPIATWLLDTDGDGTAEHSGAGTELPKQVEVTYDAVGQYDAVLTAIDQDGATATSEPVLIRTFEPLVVDAGPDQTVPKGLPIDLEPTFSGGPPEATPVCQWTGPVASPDRCDTRYTPISAGTHTLRLTVTRGAYSVSDDLIVTVPDQSGGDVDNDGVADETDNCWTVANAGQEDLDGDGRGDACDTDDDGDGSNDANDNCPTLSNDQADADGDGAGDACDADDDDDGVPDGSDNCPLHANMDQDDLDGDGLGDVCDRDRDGDGTPDATDHFPDDPEAASDRDGDGVPDASGGQAGTGGSDGSTDSFFEDDAADDKESPGFGAVGVLVAIGAIVVSRRCV